MQNPPTREIRFLEALAPLVALVVVLVTNGYIFGDDAMDGANQVALIMAAMLAASIAFYKGYTWEKLQEGILHNIHTTMPAILILLMIGAMSGAWLLSGIVPTMIYYGLKILSPSFFLVAACLICAIVTLCTGSSWSTIATVGVALLGIGKTLGWAEEVVAGAIISGAYFSDKLSPLSDTTILAAGVAGTPLFTHIRYMLVTSIPSLVLTLVIFGVIGLTNEVVATSAELAHISTKIQEAFFISPWLLLVPLVVMVMIVKRVPAFPALIVGTLLGGFVATLCQPQMILHVAEHTELTRATLYKAVVKAIYGNIHAATGDAMLDSLLSASGMQGMLGTIWLILTASFFGGVMEVTGMLQVLAHGVIGKIRSAGSLVASTIGACIFFNLTVSDQYLGILLPGKIYKPLYKKAGLAPQNLSRALEDGATVTSPLIPWNTCGATQATVLGIATLAYLPYCFFNLINPLVGVLVGYLSVRLTKTDS